MMVLNVVKIHRFLKLFVSLALFGGACLFAEATALIDQIRALDVEAIQVQHQDKHFKEEHPLIIKSSEDAQELTRFRAMGLNVEHLRPDWYEPQAWEHKLRMLGQTIYVVRPDLVAVNELYPSGIAVFGERVLAPLGYRWLIDEAGGKYMFGQKMCSGLLYREEMFTVVETQAIPLSNSEAVQRTRDIFRVTMKLQATNEILVIYVVHLKSRLPMNKPIESKKMGETIASSEQLRRLQMELLRTWVEKDMGENFPVWVIGDFNTVFSIEGVVNPLAPAERAFEVTPEDRLQVESASPIQDLVTAGKGYLLFEDLEGYSYVFEKRAFKLDNMVFFPAPDSSKALSVVEVRDRRILRFEWHLNPETGFPQKRHVTDHLPLVADFFIISPTL